MYEVYPVPLTQSGDSFIISSWKPYAVGTG